MRVCADEAERRQYEEWLEETQNLLQMQQGYLEQQITGHRKAKRALSAKQRAAKKAGRPVTEDELAQLRNMTQQQAAVQKQLEQVSAAAAAPTASAAISTFTHLQPNFHLLFTLSPHSVPSP